MLAQFRFTNESGSVDNLRIKKGSGMVLQRLVLVVAVCLLVCACSKEQETEGDILATINGQKITLQEFENFLRFKRIPNDDENLEKRIMEQYLDREALAAVIEQQKVLDSGLIEAELDEFKKEMIISRYFEKYLAEQVTDQAVASYYNSNAAEYEQRKARAGHILIRLNKNMSEEERQVKLTTAQEAFSKIKSGEDFSKIAEEYSEDKISAKKGGDLGWIKEGTIDQRFSKTVFALEEGSVSEPFETPFGFHIVKLIEKPQIVKQPLKAVAGDIRYQLRNKAKDTEMERLLKEVKIEK